MQALLIVEDKKWISEQNRMFTALLLVPGARGFLCSPSSVQYPERTNNSAGGRSSNRNKIRFFYDRLIASMGDAMYDAMVVTVVDLQSHAHVNIHVL